MSFSFREREGNENWVRMRWRILAKVQFTDGKKNGRSKKTALKG
jgi:hypothetical protein